MVTLLQVNIRSNVPIYVQLVEQILHALEVGMLSPGDTLPSVRELANELSIASSTIARAYKELQRMGFIESRAGKGTVVLGQIDERLRSQQQEELLERVLSVVHDGSRLGLNAEALRVQFELAVKQFFSEYQRQGDKR
ncbi:GntR family transcriptional regulator [Ktedonosporobacter rubrisoli]|uniref:GntR family transcriptional regulator n=1 Tax=Ktedonosporobacter rubrisoli TaxID=2509675 RepID=A0A4V0YY58_KTERU|nr:GntR family transcriptional regulator [Ktedonosporobacter rubrisoli]QBD75071.1 GntR family transcriptional regulator [Ktedonosporobacter rubrisoli]